MPPGVDFSVGVTSLGAQAEAKWLILANTVKIPDHRGKRQKTSRQEKCTVIQEQ